ncbi:MAG TPA: Hint domain-containing protein [Gemmatimonadales bacterium]|nr:Hint domain-containing protein [Gemmatimonadales bacterium]
MLAAWQALRAVEDAAIPGLTERFLEALRAVRRGADVTAIESALDDGDLEQALRAVPLADFAAALSAVLPEIEQVSANAHAAAGAAIRAGFPPTEAARAAGRLGFALDQLSPPVIQAIRDEAATLVTEVTEETRAAIRQAIETGYVAGKGSRIAAQRIRQIVGLTTRQAQAVSAYRATLEAEGRSAAQVDRMVSRYAVQLLTSRASTIARTETNAAMNRGQRATWRDLSATGLLDTANWRREWLTVLPAPGVCPICAPLDKQQAPIHGVYTDGSDGPPAHPNCFLPGTIVASSGGIAAHYERWFDGEIVRIRVESGDEIAVTPNHPILTPSGWVPARELDEGQYVLQALDPNATVRAFDPENYDVQSRIEEVADALRMAANMSAVSMPLTAEDFHGDGAGSEDVHVIRTNRALRSAGDAVTREQLHQQALVSTDKEPPLLASARALGEFGRAPTTSAHGGMSSAGASSAFGRSSTGRRNSIALADGAYTKATTHEGDSQSARGVSAAFCELHARLAGHVTPVKITQLVHGNRFVGHVYNLETGTGWYIANTVLVHNCRCTEVLVPLRANT